MKFTGIWFNDRTEVKRESVDANDVTDASQKIHLRYAGQAEPARCLTVIPNGGYGNTACEVN